MMLAPRGEIDVRRQGDARFADDIVNGPHPAEQGTARDNRLGIVMHSGMSPDGRRKWVVRVIDGMATSR
jgi:hypothetical protein